MNEPKITKSQGPFALSCRVELNIRADAERLWKILTDARDFPRWNSTVTSIEGEIREGERLLLRVPGTKQTFKPTVSDVSIKQRMKWIGGIPLVFRGVRTFELQRRYDRSTDFVMEEHFSGLMLLLIKNKLPDFGPIFTAFANDLRREAEGQSNKADSYGDQLRGLVDILQRAGFSSSVNGDGKARFVHSEHGGRSVELSHEGGKFSIELFENPEEAAVQHHQEQTLELAGKRAADWLSKGNPTAHQKQFDLL